VRSCHSQIAHTLSTTMKFCIFAPAASPLISTGSIEILFSFCTALRQKGHLVRWVQRPAGLGAVESAASHVRERRRKVSTSGVPAEASCNNVLDFDAIIVCSHLAEGGNLGEWLTQKARGIVMFYDLAPGQTLDALEEQSCDYLTPELLKAYPVYLHASLDVNVDRRLQKFGPNHVERIAPAVQTHWFEPTATKPVWELGIASLLAADFTGSVEDFFLKRAKSVPAGRLVVPAGASRRRATWPENIDFVPLLSMPERRSYYSSSRYCLHPAPPVGASSSTEAITRALEAACAGAPLLCHQPDGISGLLRPFVEMLPVNELGDVSEILEQTSEMQRSELAHRARARILKEHTVEQRADQLLTLAKRETDFFHHVEVARAVA